MKLTLEFYNRISVQVNNYDLRLNNECACVLMHVSFLSIM